MGELARQIATIQTRLFTLLVSPTANLKASLMLYGIIALILLTAIVGALFTLLGAADEDRPAQSAGSAGRPEPASTKPKRPRGTWGRRTSLVIAGAAILVLAAAWVLTGYSTSDPKVCVGCHSAAATHVKAQATKNPHEKVACVSCHEGGGVLGRYVWHVPSRLVHFVSEGNGTRLQDDYGAVTSKACSSCHTEALKGVATDETRGLKISHTEPIAASAACLDCHTLSGGVVAGHNAGMDPCLRCHDSKKVSAACPTCHDQSVSGAVRSRTDSFTAEQIVDIKCGGCHDEKKECDTCHGVRMPHSTEFMAYAHARAGAVDFWYNGGKTCKKCHTATRRPCQKCHTAMLGVGHGNPSGLQDSHKKAVASGCDSCHRTLAYMGTRDFCRDICHTPGAIANSPR